MPIWITKSVELAVHARQPIRVRCANCHVDFVTLAGHNIGDSVSETNFELIGSSHEKRFDKLRRKLEKRILEAGEPRVRTHCPSCRFPYRMNHDPNAAPRFISKERAKVYATLFWGAIGAAVGLAAMWLFQGPPWLAGLALMAGGFGYSTGESFDATPRDKPLAPDKGHPGSVTEDQFVESGGDHPDALELWAITTGVSRDRGHLILPGPLLDWRSRPGLPSTPTTPEGAAT